MKETCLHQEAILFMNSTEAKITTLYYHPYTCSLPFLCLIISRAFSKLPVLFMPSMRVWWENVNLRGHPCPEKSLLRHSAHAWICFPAGFPHPQKPACGHGHLPHTGLYLGHAHLKTSTYGRLICKSPMESCVTTINNCLGGTGTKAKGIISFQWLCVGWP